jgi:hypothetical protein
MAHPVWAEGPDCDESCPGETSQWHDGYAWGTEKAVAEIERLDARLLDYLAILDKVEKERDSLHKAARKRIETGHDVNCRALMPSAGRPHRCDCGQSGLEAALGEKL